MGVRTIKKQLAGKEDLLLGKGSEVQTRYSGNVEITKLNATHLEGAIIVDTIKDLLALPIDKLQPQAKVYILGYHSKNDGGQGLFYYDDTVLKSQHNGGTIIDPSKAFPQNWTDQTQLDDWFNTVSTTGYGVWVRIWDDVVNAKWYGAKTDGSDNTIPLQKAKENPNVLIPSGVSSSNIEMIVNGITFATGVINAANLPTTDPLVLGQLWVDSANGYVVKVSQG